MAMLSLSQLNTGISCLRAPYLGPTTPRLPFQISNSRKTLSISLPPGCFGRKNEEQKLDAKAGEKEEGEEEFKVLVALRSMYNQIIIVDSPTRRMLLLDNTHNVHSVICKGQEWTGSYWDQFASLPAVIPPGPIAILGLGGGTVAHLLLNLWPSVQLEGWELDQILIDKAREYFGLSKLENPNESGGILHVHVGDALSPDASIPGGFAGIIVDLFSDGEVLPELAQTKTWLQLSERLMPNGRIMVNCGGSVNALLDEIDDSLIPADRNWTDNYTLKTMSSAFGDQLNWKKLPRANGANYFALTGTLPDLASWSRNVPDQLSSSVKQWKSIS
ncbi:hypothetical protein V2J09_005043 [Rumex salicifolius]